VLQQHEKDDGKVLSKLIYENILFLRGREEK